MPSTVFFASAQVSKTRKSLVELVFGQIKSVSGFESFVRRGLVTPAVASGR